MLLPSEQRALCSDGKSNDGDDYIDCDDFDCNGTEVCGGAGEPENTDEACSDGIDNDKDTYVDCKDFDCTDTDYCKSLPKENTVEASTVFSLGRLLQ